MSDHTAETPSLAHARAAGLLYLVIIVCGIFAEAGVRGGVIVAGDAAATAANIRASEGLYRIGFLADSLVFLSDAAVAVLLYLLLRPVSNALALVAAAFRLVQTAVLALNLLGHYAALLILNGDGYAAAFGPEQRDALAYLALDLHGHGYDLALLFFGVHCLLLGWLLIRSAQFPGVIGVLMIGAGIAYLTGTYTLFLFPAYVDTVSPVYLVALVAEVSFCLWLLVKGLRTPA